jgi:hypothetical protein
MTIDELRDWHIQKAKRYAVLALNVKAPTAGEVHRKRAELQRQAEFHSDAVHAIDDAAAHGVTEVPRG